MKLSRGLLQAYEAQNFCYDALMALKAALSEGGTLKVAREDALSIKALVSAWESAQQRVAFHRRVPSPGVLKPEPKAPPRRRAFSSTLGPFDPPEPARTNAMPEERCDPVG